MARSRPASPSGSLRSEGAPGSPDHSPTPASAPRPLPLVSLTYDELAAAPQEVLIPLVERLQDELARVSERVDALEQEHRDERAERKRVERELEGARNRVDELLADQGRTEEELAGRMEVLEKLRGTVRELEREKREATKRYREQSETFESERQTWYDQEQHYKLRISNLSSGNKRNGRPAARKSAPADFRIEEDRAEAEGADREDNEPDTPRPDTLPSRSSSASPAPSSASARSTTPSTAATSDSPTPPTPAELSLRAQLDSLTTAHSSLSATLHKLQAEMADLKRVYQDVQEQNESYEILLGEKTLSGEMRGTALFRQSFSWGESGIDGPEGDHAKWSGAFGFAGGLDAVGEEGELPLGVEEEDDDSTESEGEQDQGAKDSEDIERVLLESRGTGSPNSGAVAAEKVNKRKRSPRLPKTSAGSAGGGGLDLAAELEMAQEHDDLDEVEIERQREKDERRKKRREEKARKREEQRKAHAVQMKRDGSLQGMGEAELQAEIRQLRDANKALTLYVSKIVDRVCSQEGFEKVLAVDYRQTPRVGPDASPPTPGPPPADKKPRPASMAFFRASPSPSPAPPTPARKVEPSTPMSAASYVTAPVASPSPADPSRSTPSGPRKSGGFGWDSVTSVFARARSTSATPSPTSAPGMKPLMLSETARKLELGEDHEDEDDRRERARIHAEMIQLGFDPPPPSRLAAAAGGSASPSARSPGEGALMDQERARALEALEKQSEGLTELPPRRMSLLRRDSTRTSSGAASPVQAQDFGLGIREEEGGPEVGAEGTSVEEKEKPSEDDDQAPFHRKALRRLSAAISSPQVT
ncbi:hypothetical protein Rhopal_002670-T1 [Rhodotorula paludigena]|uniref:BZIP domain-containing protein n=1 Tax=Rhodotorula paludigena TaxID=86838 RepID=A0AAV5GHT2_9BASI|nr:hypothetical protein Rhopal_002670-T1 [Rhodotorula paludigena]